MRKKRILIVEDESIVSAHLKHSLQKMNYETAEIISSGEESLNYLENNSVDLIIMDIQLNGKLDGIQTAKHIQEKFSLPLIFLTAYLDDETLMQAKKSEPYGYILKPFDEKDLRLNIELALVKHEASMKVLNSEKKYKNLFENAGDAIITFNLKTKLIEEVNSFASDLFGLSKEELINNSIQKIITNKNLFFDKVKELNKQNRAANFEYSYNKKDGSCLFLSLNISKIDITKNETLLLIIRDITENKKLSNELIDAKEKAEEMNRLKSNFLANISHELRTPLNSILGFASLLIEELESAEHKMMCDRIHQSGKRLLTTLNNIIDLSRIESNKVDSSFSHLNLFESIDLVVKNYKEAVVEKGIFLKTIVKKDNLITFLDENIFQKIVANIISNAIKFTHQGGIFIIIESETINDTHWGIIKIKDTGIGIAKEHYNLIFDEFRQVSEGVIRNFDGSGLGLSITKKFIELMGGTISVESDVGVGSTFIISFPLTEKPEPKKAVDSSFEETTLNIITHSKDKNEKSKKVKETNVNLPLILLVEDDEMSSDLTVKFLAEICRVEHVADGYSAVELAKKNKYDVILMDINLKSSFSGINATNEIRKINGYEKTPIVSFTAYVLAGDRENFLEHGFTHYLSKPFSKQEIVEFVTALMNK